MCGIVGLLNKNHQNIDLEILSGMASTLNHRGPDDEGYFLDKNLGFYHKRLSIIDLKSGKQPMSFGEFTIVFNGEIYNYIELRDELKKKGHDFRTNSDTEVILKSYDEYGIDLLDHLNGMFAFLLLDKRRNILIAARDQFGIKPLYYYTDNEKLIFASEIKALIEHPNVKAEPNYDTINEYLILQYVLESNTLFKNVKQVKPGHFLIIDLNTFQQQEQKYWEANFSVDHHHTEDYFIYELDRLLNDTVKIQLRSDVPLGTYLSGGLDSSLVTSLAANHSNQDIKSFVGAFKEGENFDETKYACEVAKQCRSELYRTYPSEDDFIDVVPKLIYYMDEPAAGPGLFPQYMVSKLASENVKVVLGGQGGDEIFGGYTRYVVAYLEQAIKGAILETNEEGEHIVSLNSILPNLPYLKSYKSMIKEFLKDGFFDPMDRRYFRLINRKNGDATLLTNEFQTNYTTDLVYKKFEKVFNDPNTLSYYNKMTHFDMISSLPALLQVEDRVSMACSLESRIPLLDKRIVNLITSMPPAMKFKGAEMKYILKKAISKYLPPMILDRKDKMGFPVPLQIWAKGKLNNFFKDILLSKACKERGIFNPKRVEELICNEREYGRVLWGLLSLEIWFQTFIDQKNN